MCILWLLISFILLLFFLPSLFYPLLVLPLLVLFGKSSSENGWQGINVIIAILVLIATCFAAYAAFQSYRTTRRIGQTNLYYHRQAIYSSGEMLRALGIMEEFYTMRDKNKESFNKALMQYRYNNNPRAEWETKNEKGETIAQYALVHDYSEVKQARRQISHFFLTTFEMFTKKDLDKASFQKICAYGAFEFLYNIVEWFELADAYGWKYDRDTFTNLLHQSGRSPKEIEELEKLRPPETWAEVEQMIQLNQP